MFPDAFVGKFDDVFFRFDEFEVLTEDLPAIGAFLPVVSAVDAIRAHKDGAVVRPRLRRFARNGDARNRSGERIDVRVLLVRIRSVRRDDLVVFANPEDFIGEIRVIRGEVFYLLVSPTRLRFAAFSGEIRGVERFGVVRVNLLRTEGNRESGRCEKSRVFEKVATLHDYLR